MGEEEEKAAETPQPPTTTETPDTQPQKEEKELPQQPSPPPPQPPTEDRAALVELKELQPADDKAMVPAVVLVEKEPEPSSEKKPEEEGTSINRDAVLARVETEKRMSLIRAWEDNEKCKAENKAQKNLSSIDAWENSKKASIEAELKLNEERLEKEKAIYAEKMRNKIGMIHKEADEKKAMVEARKGEELLKAEEMAANYRATGKTPKKMFGCF